MKLFCIPYAGAGASTYGPWKRRFSGLVSIEPIQLPGREEQVDRPFSARFNDLAELVTREMLGKIDAPSGTSEPYAVFGHSMGALLAFEAVHKILKLCRKAPVALIVSAFPAPSIYKPRLTVEALERDGYHQLHELLGSAFTSMFADKLFFEYASRIMRADISLCEGYKYSPLPQLEIPVYAFGSNSDNLCEIDELEAWKQHCTGPVQVKVFDGDHFYFKGNELFEKELELIITSYN